MNINWSKTVKTIAISASVLLSANSMAMDKYIETALIDVCKTAATDKTVKYANTVKSYRLNEKDVAQKVVCNGKDIASFAETHGAYKVAKRISDRSGTVKITDIAMLNNKWSVNFEE